MERAVVAIGSVIVDDVAILWCTRRIAEEMIDAGLTGGDVWPTGYVTDPHLVGIWIWEGELEPFGYDEEYDFVGNFRSPTDAEWDCLRRGVSPLGDESDE